MHNDPIRVDWNGATCVIQLNRPEKANALSAAMLQELVSAVHAASGRAKVIVLHGIGRVFSAGADIDEAHAGLAKSGLWEDLSGAIAQSPCLTIAALNGTVAGGAFGMVLACDLRVSVPEAKFFYPVMRLGFLPQPSDPERLVALVGPARAKLILMAGQKVTADEALAWGLVDRIEPADRLMPTVTDLSADALGATPDHILRIKTMIRSAVRSVS